MTTFSAEVMSPLRKLANLNHPSPPLRHRTRMRYELAIGYIVVNIQYADQGLHLCSALLPVAQSLAPAHLSPAPDTRARRNLRMREMLFGELDLRL